MNDDKNSGSKTKHFHRPIDNKINLPFEKVVEKMLATPPKKKASKPPKKKRSS